MFHHTSVMLNGTINYLDVEEDGVYIDCTLGGAGHTLCLLNQLDDDGRLIAVDQDQTAIDNAREVLKDRLHKVTFVHSNFHELTQILKDLNIEKIDGVYYGLGVSSPQLDIPEQGFSRHHDATLNMRIDQTQELTAYEIINNWSYGALAKIFYRYGGERFLKQIARRIKAHHEQQPITTTLELVDIIKEDIPAKARGKGEHPAKRVLQALRIAVNDELSAFGDSIEQTVELVRVDGRISVITFRSSKDRLCKQVFQEYGKDPEVPRGLPVMPGTYTPRLKHVSRKPITTTEEDLGDNNRAQSAKLRVTEILRQGAINNGYRKSVPTI